MFATLLIIAAISQDPFQAAADQRKQAEAKAATDAIVAKHQKDLQTAAAPDAEATAKLQSRQWHGRWWRVNPDGTKVPDTYWKTPETYKHEPTGKLLRVYRRFDTHYRKWRPTFAEIQDDKGRLWQLEFPLANDDLGYVHAFLADWEKKHPDHASPDATPKPDQPPAQQDPFQGQAEQQLKAQAAAAAKAIVDKRQAEIDKAAAPDSETAAKMKPRVWRGQWRKLDSKGLVTRDVQRSVEGTLIRVHNVRHARGYEEVEIQSTDGSLWRDYVSTMDKTSVAYVNAFLADWEKKRSNHDAVKRDAPQATGTAAPQEASPPAPATSTPAKPDAKKTFVVTFIGGNPRKRRSEDVVAPSEAQAKSVLLSRHGLAKILEVEEKK